MNKANLALVALATFGSSSLALAAQRGPEVVGQGPMKTEARRIGAFRKLQAGHAFRIRFQIGSSRKLEIRAHANLLPILKTEVRGDTLTLEATRSYSTKEPVEVTITNPELEAISLSGASSATVERLNEQDFRAQLSGASRLSVRGTATDLSLTLSGASRLDMGRTRSRRLRADVSGASRADLGGTADEATLGISGAGRVDLSDLEVSRARVEGSGAGILNLRVREELDVKGSGAFNTTYRGTPRVRKSLTGGARVSGS